MSEFLNLNEVSLKYQVTPHTIKKWVQEGLPCVQIGKGKGKPYKFDSEDIHEWILDRKEIETESALMEQEAEEIKGELDAEIKQARLRNLDRDFELKTLKLAVQAGELVPIDRVAHVFEDQLVYLRTNIRALPSKLSPRLSKLNSATEIKQELQTALDEILNDLAVPDKYKSHANKKHKRA